MGEGRERGRWWREGEKKWERKIDYGLTQTRASALYSSSLQNFVHSEAGAASKFRLATTNSPGIQIAMLTHRWAHKSCGVLVIGGRLESRRRWR